MRFLLNSLLAVLFSVPAFAQHYETRVLRGPVDGRVGQWETVEIGIRLPNMERSFRAFLEEPGGRGMNPYAQTFLRIQFICKGKTYNVQAFYMQDAEPDETANRFVPAVTQWPWRVRFAVPDTGAWQCVLLTGDPVEMAVPQSTGISFTCIPGKKHGHLSVAPGNHYLRFSDGAPFFAIGQNIAWADEPVLKGQKGPYPVYSAGFYDIFHYFHNLADNGGNFARIVMAPWSTGIEWEQAGVYSQQRAWVMDSILRICETRGIFLYVCVEMHSGYTVNYTPEYSWNAHPYKKALGLAAPTEVLTNDSAIRLFQQKMRYMLARWGYSPNVAVVELLSEMNGWDDYYGHVDDFVRWHESIFRYIRRDIGDTVKLLTSCFGVPPYGGLYDLPDIQLTSSHKYTNDFRVHRKHFDIINKRSIAFESRGLRTRWDKPFIFGEMGMTNGPGNNCDADDWEHCSDLSFHNALWATAFSGGFGTGLNWWQWKNDAYRGANFPAIRWFIDSVATSIQDCHDNREFRGNGLEAYYCQSERGWHTYGWVHNTSYWWGNNPDSCLDRSGKRMPLPKDDDKPATFENRAGEVFTIDGLDSRSYYTVILYDTRQKNKEVYRNRMKPSKLGKLRIPMPPGPDFAFKIQRNWPGKF